MWAASPCHSPALLHRDDIIKAVHIRTRLGLQLGFAVIAMAKVRARTVARARDRDRVREMQSNKAHDFIMMMKCLNILWCHGEAVVLSHSVHSSST